MIEDLIIELNKQIEQLDEYQLQILLGFIKRLNPIND